MKNILLLVHDDDGQEARLQTALDLTRALEGHMSCIDVTMMPMMAADIHGGTAQAVLLEEERAREGQNKAAITARLANEDVSWDWTDVIGGMAQAVLDASTLSDLIVLNRKLDAYSYPDMRDIASSIVMKARAPVVAVPETQKSFSTDRAMIAWDGSESCASTMRSCIGLLKLSSEVRLFTAIEKSNGLEATAAAQYLSRHGIHATVEMVERGVQDADMLIAAHANSWKADYVLMGAFGRGRLRETFGGVTKRMLGSATLPLLLGH
ncbi:MAG: universal stress protein UspA [Sphingomonadales bacterium]|nr:MAG: universal stress protein UspA [Sphingomonadales bacterium]TNF02686.1 MAG: universal stress protein UspA [Sphingomonadales bacterium]